MVVGVSVENLHVIILIPESDYQEVKSQVSVENLHVIILIRKGRVRTVSNSEVSVENLHVIILIRQSQVSNKTLKCSFSRKPACYNTDTIIHKSDGYIDCKFQSKTCML